MTARQVRRGHNPKLFSLNSEKKRHLVHKLTNIVNRIRIINILRPSILCKAPFDIAINIT